MNLCVLDLGDAGLAIGDGAGLLVESPAYATLEAAGAVLGEAARARARLDPRRTHTRFWQRLGTEPLHNAPPHTRHHADLAWQHLLALHALAGKPEELILAVPGSFTREQLAILLGIAERCPFRAIGLVDSALAAATQAAPAAAIVLHLELQLHQCVLSRIEREDGMLVRRSALALPGTGLIDLQERWARRAAAAFIQQGRFDPLHDAATEQQLYDRLPDWLAQLDAADDTLAELHTGAQRHQANLRAGDMLEAVQPQYTELLEALAREAAGGGVLLGARLARLPRFAARLVEARVLGVDAPIRGALAHAAAIRSEERALRFVTRLPAPAAAPQTAPRAPGPAPAASPVVAGAPPPTHLLAGDRAWVLCGTALHLRRGEHDAWQLAAQPDARSACTLRRIDGAWYALPVAGQLLRIDGLPVAGRTRLATGSRLAIEGGPELRLVAEARADDDGA